MMRQWKNPDGSLFTETFSVPQSILNFLLPLSAVEFRFFAWPLSSYVNILKILTVHFFSLNAARPIHIFIIFIVFAMLGMLSPASRGALMTAAIFLYVFMGLIAGYHSGRLYKTMKGKEWKKAAFLVTIITHKSYLNGKYYYFFFCNL